MAEKEEEIAGGPFELEYVTSAVPMNVGEGIVVQVVNDSGVTENTRVVIFRNTGAGAVTVVDTGRVVVTPTWNWSLGSSITEAGNFWLRIQTTSEALVPQASFQRVASPTWDTIASYEPGDFAVFGLTRKRLW